MIGEEYVGVGITDALQPQLPRLGVLFKVRVAQPLAPLREQRRFAHLALELLWGHDALLEDLLAHAVAHPVGQDGKLGQPDVDADRRRRGANRQFSHIKCLICC